MILDYPCKWKVYNAQENSARFLCYLEYDDIAKEYYIQNPKDDAYYLNEFGYYVNYPFVFTSKDYTMEVIKKYL